ncbi:unnamed protein product [Effrenium voratum]|nr:unnamed protein product [Effrenium voratum]
MGPVDAQEPELPSLLVGDLLIRHPDLAGLDSPAELFAVDAPEARKRVRVIGGRRDRRGADSQAVGRAGDAGDILLEGPLEAHRTRAVGGRGVCASLSACLRVVAVLICLTFCYDFCMADGSGGGFNMQDIGNILNQLVQEQRTQQTRLEELGRGVLGTQTVTEGVIGSVVDQAQGAFQQQQQHTQDQVTQIAGAVQQLQSQLQQFVQSEGNLTTSAAGTRGWRGIKQVVDCQGQRAQVYIRQWHMQCSMAVTFQDWALITLVDAQIPGTWEILESISQKQPKSSLDQITILTGFPHLARRPNGLEAFRMLQVRFNPLTVGRQRANLTKITSPPESVPLSQLPSEIIAWENRIVEYESKPGADSVSECLKMATIVAMCPAKLKEHLQLNEEIIVLNQWDTSWALMRDEEEEERRLMLQTGSWSAKEVYGLESAEVFSPPRIAEAGRRKGCLSGIAFDLRTQDEDGNAWDLSKPEVQKKAEELIDLLQPELIIGCPPCGPFSALQWLNHPKMTEQQVQDRLKDAVAHVEFCEGLIGRKSGGVTLNANTGEVLDDLRWSKGISCNMSSSHFQVWVPRTWRRCSITKMVGRNCNAVIRGILREVKMKYPLDSLSFGPVNQEVDLDMSAEDDWMTYVDEISGKALNAALVRAARQEELEYADRYGIWDEVPTQECWDQTKAAPISTRWIDTNKGDEARPNYRSCTRSSHQCS